MTNLTLRDVELSYSAFEKASLANVTFRTVDFHGARFKSCSFEDVTIDGIDVARLLAAYRAAQAD